jgi:hypothetical protein
MTTPTVKPSNAKAWTSLIGGLLGSLLPVLAQVAGFLPAPWGLALTGVLAVISAITGKAVHLAKYVPADAVLVPVAGGGTVRGPWKP